MNRFVCGLGSLGLFISLICQSLSQADEPAQRFLDELRDRGYYDIAFDYLQQMSSSDLVDSEFKIRIPFEQAETLLKSAEQTRDIDGREKLVVLAEELLKKFAASNPPPELLSQAQRTRASAIFSRGKLLLRKSQSDRLTAVERQKLVADARAKLLESNQVFEQNREHLRSVYENFKIDPQDPDSQQKRERLRAEYAQIRLMSPTIKEQIGDTYDAGSTEQKRLFQTAAEEFAELSGKYNRYAAGVKANLYAGRCFTKLKRYDDALPHLLDVLAQSDVGRLRQYKREAATIALVCWEAKEAYTDIIAHLQPLMDTMSKRESRRSDWLFLQLAFAKACRAKAKNIEDDASKRKKTEFKRKIRDLNRNAVNFARQVAKSSSEHRQEAQSLLALLEPENS